MTRKANVEDSLFECTLPIIFEVAPREPKKRSERILYFIRISCLAASRDGSAGLASAFKASTILVLRRNFRTLFIQE